MDCEGDADHKDDRTSSNARGLILLAVAVGPALGTALNLRESIRFGAR